MQIKEAVIRFRNLYNLRDTSYNLRVDEGGVSKYNIEVFCDCACIGFRKKNHQKFNLKIQFYQQQ